MEGMFSSSSPLDLAVALCTRTIILMNMTMKNMSMGNMGLIASQEKSPEDVNTTKKDINGTAMNMPMNRNITKATLPPPGIGIGEP